MKKKKQQSRVSEVDRRNQSGAGPNSRKTRPDVPSTPANKASTGKQVHGRRANG